MKKKCKNLHSRVKSLFLKKMEIEIDKSEGRYYSEEVKWGVIRSIKYFGLKSEDIG